MSRTSRKQQSVALSQPPSEQKIYHVAVYARLSIEDNGKNSDSIESQIELLENYIKNDSSMQETAVFIDNGYTGTNFERPEFQRMLEAAQQGLVNCVVVKDLSRLGRNYIETGALLEKTFPTLGLRVIAINDGYDSASATNNIQLSASLSNIINDFYAKDISRKVTSALKTKMEKGEYIGSWEKYGYLKDPDNKNHLIINPDTAPVVRLIFRWRSEGMSYMGINKKLNALSIPSPGQYKAERGIITNNNQKNHVILWNKHIVSDILKDITYVGHMAQRKSTQCLYAGVPFSHVDETHWIVVYNTHEAIIEQPLFDTVQEINRKSAERTKANSGKYDFLPKEKNIYGAMLVCADCGARMKLHRSFSRNKDKVYFTFNCPTYEEHGAVGCSSRIKRKADLDEAVFQAIKSQMALFLDTADIIKALLAKKQSTKNNGEKKKEITELKRKIDNLRSILSNMYMDVKEGLLSDEDYVLQKQRYQARIAALEVSLQEMMKSQTESAATLIGKKRWAAIVSDYFNEKTLTEEILTACVEKIKIHADGSLEIIFNYMQEFQELLDTKERLKKEVA